LLEMARLTLDARVRRWLRKEVKGQQVGLGTALQEAGLEGRGQSWVSRYINEGEAKPASLDHLVVIAQFFERTLAELLDEIVGRDLRSHSEAPGSFFDPGGTVHDPSSARHVAELTKELRHYKSELANLEGAASRLLELTLKANSDEDRNPGKNAPKSGGGDRKTG